MFIDKKEGVSFLANERLGVRLDSSIKTYEVQFKDFEGPFDLLFHLIEKNKLDIYDVPIGEITDGYMEYIMKMQELDLDIASEFIVMASTLLYIKSKSLLPTKSKEDKGDMEVSSKDELILKLIEYRKYKSAAGMLKKKHAKWSKVCYKRPEKISFPKENKSLELSLDKMITLYEGILKRNAEKENNNRRKMIRILRVEKVTVKQKIQDILNKIKDVISFKFKEMFGKKSKIEVVTGFMAVLELIKLKRVVVTQDRPFGEIVINKNNNLGEDEGEVDE